MLHVTAQAAIPHLLTDEIAANTVAFLEHEIAVLETTFSYTEAQHYAKREQLISMVRRLRGDEEEPLCGLCAQNEIFADADAQSTDTPYQKAFTDGWNAARQTQALGPLATPKGARTVSLDLAGAAKQSEPETIFDAAKRSDFAPLRRLAEECEAEARNAAANDGECAESEEPAPTFKEMKAALDVLGRYADKNALPFVLVDNAGAFSPAQRGMVGEGFYAMRPFVRYGIERSATDTEPATVCVQTLYERPRTDTPANAAAMDAQRQQEAAAAKALKTTEKDAAERFLHETRASLKTFEQTKGHKPELYELSRHSALLIYQAAPMNFDALCEDGRDDTVFGIKIRYNDLLPLGVGILS